VVACYRVWRCTGRRGISQIVDLANPSANHGSHRSLCRTTRGSAVRLVGWSHRDLFHDRHQCTSTTVTLLFFLMCMCVSLCLSSRLLKTYICMLHLQISYIMQHQVVKEAAMFIVVHSAYIELVIEWVYECHQYCAPYY
jgi:hypothetical protein